MAGGLYARRRKRASAWNGRGPRSVGATRRIAMPDVVPPVPDPALEAKPARQMAREGEREGDVLFERDHSQSAPEESDTNTASLPPTPPNGD